MKNSEKNSIGEEGAEELGEEGAEELGEEGAEELGEEGAEELGEEGEVAVPLSLLVAVPLSLLYWTRLLTLISCKYHLYSRFSFFLYCIQQCVSVTVSVCVCELTVGEGKKQTERRGPFKN